MSSESRPPALSVANLLQRLRPVTSWHALGVQLDVPTHHLDEIARSLAHQGSERCKAELFELWLQRRPDVCWEDMVHALEKTSHHKLAGELRKLLNLPSPASSSSLVATCNSCSDLQDVFSGLVDSVKRLLKEGEVKVKSVLRCLKKNLNVRLSHTPSDMEELFDTIAPYLSPFNPRLLALVVRKFCSTHASVQDRLEQYNQCLEKLVLATTMKDLAESSSSQSQSSPDSARPGTMWSKAATVTLEMVICWLPTSIHDFHLLLSRLFPQNEKLFNHMRVKCCRNSLLVTWLVPESSIRSLRSLARERLQMMRLIGVLHLAVNNTTVVHYNTNDLVNFNAGLVEAVRAVDKEAICLLLELGADPNQQDEQGNTALSIARENESYDTVLHLLGGSSIKAALTSSGQNKLRNLTPPVNQLMYSSLSSSSESEDVGRAHTKSDLTSASRMSPPVFSSLPDSDDSSRARSPSLVTLHGYTGVITQRQDGYTEDGSDVVGSRVFTWIAMAGQLKGLLKYRTVACRSVKVFLSRLYHNMPAKHWLALCQQRWSACSNALLINYTLTVVMSILIVMFLISTMFLFCKLSSLNPVLSPWLRLQPWCVVFDSWNYTAAN